MNEAPFSFYTRDKAKLKPSHSAADIKPYVFKHKPIPKDTTVLKLNQQADDYARKQKIKQIAEEKLKQAAMPGTMQQDLDKRTNQPEKPLGAEYSFKPKITQPKTREDFEQS